MYMMFYLFIVIIDTFYFIYINMHYIFLFIVQIIIYIYIYIYIYILFQLIQFIVIKNIGDGSVENESLKLKDNKNISYMFFVLDPMTISWPGGGNQSRKPT